MSESDGKTRAAKFIDDTTDIIGNKLNAEVTVLQGVLQGKKIGKDSHFQTVSGTMINPLDLGAENDEPVNLPSTGEQSKASKFISKVATIGNSAAESLKEGDDKPFRSMLDKNIRGLGKQFLGPFYGLVDPLIPDMAGKGGKGGKPGGSSKSLKISKEEMKVAQRMKDKGYVYAMKVKGDDRLVYFKKSTDAGPYLRSTGEKPIWNGTIEDLVVK